MITTAQTTAVQKLSKNGYTSKFDLYTDENVRKKYCGWKQVVKMLSDI